MTSCCTGASWALAWLTRTVTSTMPALFAYPASPHLAARLEQRTLDMAAIEAATERLCERYETVLIEGAGGFLMVPLTEQLLTIDYRCCLWVL